MINSKKIIDIDTKIILNSEGILPKFFLIVLFFLSPLLSLPFIFVEIYNKKIYAQHLLAIFMGLASWLFFPIGDSYRHYITFFEIQSNPYYFEENFGAKFDFLLLSLNKIYGSLGLSFEFIKFTFSLIAYEIVFWIFRDLIKRNVNFNKNYFLYFILFYLSVSFIDITVGIRQTAATFFFVLGIYLLYYKKKSGYLFILLSIFTHFSFLLYFIPFVFLVNRHFQISTKKTVFIIILIFLFFNPIIINSLLSSLSSTSNLAALADVYINGQWSEAQTEDKNFNYLFFFWFTKVTFFVYIYLVLREKNYGLTGIAKLSLIFLAFSLCISYILFGRFIIVFVLLAQISIFQNKITKLKQWIILLVTINMLVLSGNLFQYRNIIVTSKEPNLALPVPIILANTYSEQWIYRHIDYVGRPR